MSERKGVREEGREGVRDRVGEKREKREKRLKIQHSTLYSQGMTLSLLPKHKVQQVQEEMLTVLRVNLSCRVFGSPLSLPMPNPRKSRSR